MKNLSLPRPSFLTYCLTALLAVTFGLLTVNQLFPDLFVVRVSAAAAPNAPLTASLSDSQMALAPAGSTVTYTHFITNDGVLPEIFTVDAVSRQGWNVSVSPVSLTLTSGASASLVLSVTIPVTAAPGVQGLTTLTANNTGLPAITLKVRDTTLVQSTASLPIPPAQYGQLVGGERTYSLTALISTTEFLPGLQTRTYGYSANYLGPTLVLTQGEVISISVTNQLTEVTTTHWHGVDMPGAADGGPHQPFDPGQTWQPTFPVINEASTVWYHPHPHAHEASTAATGQQAYMGLAGMIVVRDSASNALGLPQTYGVDEFPIVVQDRNFNADGSLREYPVLQNRQFRKGDYFLVNGALAPNLNVPAQMVRLHVLNGANSRYFNFGFADNRSFALIASDNALLNAPLTRTRVLLSPGERAEIVVDLSGQQGQTLALAAFNAEPGSALVPDAFADDYDRANYLLLTLDVTAPTPNPVTTLPATLNDIVPLSIGTTTITRTVTLNTNLALNGVRFDMHTINLTSTVGVAEVWVFTNASPEPHPMHLHGTPFQILARNGTPPAPDEQGWKDTVNVNVGEQVTLIKAPASYANLMAPFMYHCHLLEHEDKGMMGQFVVQAGQWFLPLVGR